jgi:hypothetical protein
MLALETLWVDFVMHNPLDAEVQLMDVTVVVKEAGIDDVASTREYLDVEVIDRIVLAARETRTVGYIHFGRLITPL